jgi:endonuclease III
VNEKKSRSEVVVDRGRAKVVLTRLFEAYVHQWQLFSHIRRQSHAPQQINIPQGVTVGSLEHRRWLFFAAMTDRREVSSRVYESHARLAEWVPKLYTQDVLGMASEEIACLLRSEKVGSPGQSAVYWPRCAKTLFGHFSGDPLNLYRELGVDGLLDFKKNAQEDPLPGFGPKILSLLALFLSELKLMPMPQDAFPVDVHVQRFAISAGILRGGAAALNEKVEKVLRPLLCSIAIEEGWEALELSHAIWFLGNRLCSGCYRNKVARVLCPVYDECGGGASTRTYFRNGFWGFDADRHRKGGCLTFRLPSSPLFP